MYQSPGCEIIHDFEDRIACCKNEQTAPNQTVPLLIVADQDINDKQDVFKYIVQRAIERIHFAISNVSSITAFRQLLFQSPQRGLWKALKIRFQRLFKADTFLDVKLIPPCGRTKVQGKFVYFRVFPCTFATVKSLQAAL